MIQRQSGLVHKCQLQDFCIIQVLQAYAILDRSLSYLPPDIASPLPVL